jgi:hypothetical protein
MNKSKMAETKSKSNGKPPVNVEEEEGEDVSVKYQLKKTKHGILYKGGGRSTTCAVVNPQKNRLLMQRKFLFLFLETTKPRAG